MKLENQVVSLELAKKLKELGFEQKSLFWWEDVWEEKIYKESVEPSIQFFKKKKPKDTVGTYSTGGKWASSWYSAYTVAELGEMFPWYYSSEKHTNDWRCGKVKSDIPFTTEKTEADSRAKMLIYLKEQNLI